MDYICKFDYCTGCQACRVACPKDAIFMHENEKGHIYPVVNNNLCIDCGRCQKVCPSLNPPSFSQLPIITYAAHIKDEYSRLISTSGGISYAISKYIVENGGFFCGVVWDKNEAKHIITSKVEELKDFQGSKYAHSDVCNVYKEIKQLLTKGNKVVFTGTPCQCAGLKAYIGKDYRNLFVVDVICHGVPSRKFLRDCISNVEETEGKKVVYVRFKEKLPDQYRTNMVYKFYDGSEKSQTFKKAFFSRLFDDNYILRDNCFNCQYSSIKRVSDLTIADFWGYIPKRLKFHDYRKGTSIVIVNTDQGLSLFNQISHLLSFEERSYKENVNPNLSTPQKKPSDWQDFWDDYLRGVSFDILETKYLHEQFFFPVTVKRIIKEWLSMLMPQGVFNFINTLIKK